MNNEKQGGTTHGVTSDLMVPCGETSGDWDSGHFLMSPLIGTVNCPKCIGILAIFPFACTDEGCYLAWELAQRGDEYQAAGRYMLLHRFIEVKNLSIVLAKLDKSGQTHWRQIAMTMLDWRNHVVQADS